MRQCWRANIHNLAFTSSAWLISVAVSLAATAQSLELARTPVRPPSQDPTYASTLIRQLDEEVAEINSADEPRDALSLGIRQASANVRRLAADLLAMSDRAGANGSLAFHYGHVIFLGRPKIDRALQRLTDDSDQQTIASAQSMLRNFNQAAAGLLRDSTWLEDQWQLRMASAVAPLVQSIALIESIEPRSHWIDTASIHGELKEQELSIEHLSEQAADSGLSQTAQDDVELIIDYLRRAEVFAELKLRIAPLKQAISELVDSSDIIRHADWMSAEQRANAMIELDRVANSLSRPETREEGFRTLKRLVEASAVIDLVTRLAADEPKVIELAEALLFENDNQIAQIDSGQLSLVADVLKRMIEFRDLEPINLKRELKQIEREILKSYREAERLLLEQLMEPAQERSMADPSFSSMVIEHKQMLEDLVRVRQSPIWAQAIAGVDAKAGESFEKQIAKLARRLMDSNRRPDAVAAMSQFEQQWSHFSVLSVEDQLQSADAATVEVTGGLHHELAAQIKSARREWCRALGDGDASGPATQRMASLWRLSDMIVEFTGAGARGGDVALLNRWAAWEIDPALPQPSIIEVSGRLKLAVAAIVQADSNALLQQLDRLDDDAPYTRLVGRLAHVLEPELAELPDAAVGALSKLAYPAAETSFLHSQHAAVAELCRAFHELQHIMKTHPQSMQQWNEYVDALASGILAELAQDAAPLSAIRGFSGDDSAGE